MPDFVNVKYPLNLASYKNQFGEEDFVVVRDADDDPVYEGVVDEFCLALIKKEVKLLNLAYELDNRIR